MIKEQILIIGLKPYLEDPSRRSVINGDCVYNGPNGTHCFVGQFMPNELKELGEGIYDNRGTVEVLIENYENIFENHPIINYKNLEFLEKCQILHDENNHWTDEGISEDGMKYLEKIIYKFELNREEIFSQLNLEI